MKNLDALSVNELLDAAVYISRHPRRAAMQLFDQPFGKGSLVATKAVKHYCWNRVTAIKNVHLPKICRSYTEIANSIMAGIPEGYRKININLVPRR